MLTFTNKVLTVPTILHQQLNRYTKLLLIFKEIFNIRLVKTMRNISIKKDGHISLKKYLTYYTPVMATPTLCFMEQLE